MINKNNWKNYIASKQPIYEDQNRLGEIIQTLEKVKPIVSFKEINELREALSSIEEDNAFIIQGGDCAESINQNHSNVDIFIKLINDMSNSLSRESGKKIIKIGRIAGQFGKPRTNDFEDINGVKIPIYRGDIINSHEPKLEARIADPNKMIEAYKSAFANFNYIKSKDKSIYISHESLLLDYENALTRYEENKLYNLSAHMVWIGDKTRELSGAHIQYARYLENPIGIKIGPSATEADIIALYDLLNPENKKGKVIFITRFGADKIINILPKFMELMKIRSNYPIWMCDPMHGNTFINSYGLKVRSLNKIIEEIKKFFEISSKLNIYAGGIHLEMSGKKDIKECVVSESDADNVTSELYETLCDPRINYDQALEVIRNIAVEINKFL